MYGEVCAIAHARPTPRQQNMDRGAKHGVYPRGCLLPIQRALGVFDSPRRDRIIYIQRPRNRVRSVACDVEREILAGIRSRISNASGMALQLDVPRPETLMSQHVARLLFRDAAIVIGAHGGALANVVFSKPGTTLIELYPVASPAPRTSKFCYFGLAQAAGLDHWLIESRPRSAKGPATHGFNAPLDIDPRDVLDAVDHALRRLPRLEGKMSRAVS